MKNEIVRKMFERAVRAYAKNDPKSFIHTQAAFDAADLAGWDWEKDEKFVDWALKATEPEIAAEGLRRFLDAKGGVL